MEIEPQPELEAGRYLHFKGGLYDVVDLDFCTEREEWRVEYYQVDSSTGERALVKFSRPFSMFVELVSVDGTAKPRFSRVDKPS